MRGRRLCFRFATIIALAIGGQGAASAADLKPKTVAAFDQYVAATQTRFATEVRPGGPFLHVDTLPAEVAKHAYEDLKRGEVLIYKLETHPQGKELDIPDGIMHHWVGLIFIPGATLGQALAIARDYDHRAELYKPEVIASHTISHQGNDYKIFLRLFQKKFTTVVFNSEYDIHWRQYDTQKYSADSISTRIAQVKDSDKPDGEEMPVGHDSGYLWRLNTYWRFQEKDGGVYMQCEVVSLTRDIPFGLGWLLRPLVTSIPKNSLDRALGRTREVVLEYAKRARQ